LNFVSLFPEQEGAMELTEKFLSELQNRLKVGNRRGVHLNAIPAQSRYKFDLFRLSYLGADLPADFIHALLTEQPLRFRISWKEINPDINSLFEEDQAQLVKIARSFENLINQTEAIESEKGINTFGFGYPLLARRDRSDNKLTVAPILIWSLRIKRTSEFNTWMVHRNEDDPIYLNEVLINHLQSDSKITIEPISSEMLDNGLIDKEELLDICLNLIRSINTSVPENLRDVFRQKLEVVKAIPDKKHFEKLPLTSTNALIEFGGLFSIFEVQKQNIINDYSGIMQHEGMSLDLQNIEGGTFQPLSCVETDPSQQSVLNSLDSLRNVLIQGPPGTGKSQSLTAILINALENHKKTIVVCEKRTALEVLHNALIERGLKDNCVLVKDIVKDRKPVVDSVRSRIDNFSYRSYYYPYSKEPFNNVLGKLMSLIESINRQHQKVGMPLLNSSNWPDTVGMFLGGCREIEEPFDIEFDPEHFSFASNELAELLNIAAEGQRLYNDYKPFEGYSFLNGGKLAGDNPFMLEKEILEVFKRYRDSLYADQSVIQKIRMVYDGSPEFYDLRKTGSFWYRLSSLFIKRRKELLSYQKQLFKLCYTLALAIEHDGWSQSLIRKGSGEWMLEDIEALLDAQKRYFEHEDDLFSIEFRWLNFYNRLSDVQRHLVDSLKPKRNWDKVLLVFYFNALLVKSASNELPTGGREYSQLAESLSQIGAEQLKYVAAYWFAQQIDAARNFEIRNPNLSVSNLYNKRSSHKHKRLSLRKIVQYDPELFSTFFPVVLTTPDVCSNLFNGIYKSFDIVLFDEASQLRLEDNLPAMLKGRQIIIAGDEHQMPPSNYFSKIFDGAIDDEMEIDEDDERSGEILDRDDILLSCESLLDFATELGFKKKYLDFHYRSRHPYLIDFSNHAFYSRRLQPLPNTFDYTPIKLISVDGTYSDNSNEREAEAVLSIIENNIHRLPDGKYPTVGIATFNISQRNLIKSKILDRQKLDRYAAFNEKILELESEGLFVKNLENIQGDERDVIILSTTYGRGKDGRFAQRFGPINHRKGYKLLNVIITRAKYKIYVCTSIPEKVFLNFNDYLVTEGANNRFAVFYAYLAYAKAVSDANHELRESVLNALIGNSAEIMQGEPINAEAESPFEEEVYQALKQHFDRQKLIPQFRYAGFRIDIVYDPQTDGVPRIAIECDGATYHSSREAYLYDHHRQKILEANGFVFHRIWSTNWWRNPTKETQRLVEFIKSVEKKGTGGGRDHPGVVKAFTDSFIAVSDAPSTVTQPKDELLRSNLQGVEEFPLRDQVSERATVAQTSKVTLKYLNNEKSITIQLADVLPGKVEQLNGVHRISFRSPLAQSILGKRVGDTVRVGNLDNYVEVVKIVT
jgi:very-short-patch-repair endonuclease